MKDKMLSLILALCYLFFTHTNALQGSYPGIACLPTWTLNDHDHGCFGGTCFGKCYADFTCPHMIVSKKRISGDECAEEVLAGCIAGIEELIKNADETLSYRESTTYTDCYQAYGVTNGKDYNTGQELCFIEFLENDSTRQMGGYQGSHRIWGARPPKDPNILLNTCNINTEPCIAELSSQSNIDIWTRDCPNYSGTLLHQKCQAFKQCEYTYDSTFCNSQPDTYYVNQETNLDYPFNQGVDSLFLHLDQKANGIFNLEIPNQWIPADIEETCHYDVSYELSQKAEEREKPADLEFKNNHKFMSFKKQLYVIRENKKVPVPISPGFPYKDIQLEVIQTCMQICNKDSVCKSFFIEVDRCRFYQESYLNVLENVNPNIPTHYLEKVSSSPNFTIQISQDFKTFDFSLTMNIQKYPLQTVLGSNILQQTSSWKVRVNLGVPYMIPGCEPGCLFNGNYVAQRVYHQDNKCFVYKIPGCKFACDETQTLGNYRGCQSQTKTGKSCQPWKDNTPHTISSALINSGKGTDGYHNYCRYPAADFSKIWCYTNQLGTIKEECDPLPVITQTQSCIDNYEEITCPVSCDSENFYKVKEDVKVPEYTFDISNLPTLGQSILWDSQIENPKNYEIKIQSLSLGGQPLNSTMGSIIKLNPDKKGIKIFNQGIKFLNFIEIKIKIHSFGCLNLDNSLKTSVSIEQDTPINYETSFKLQLTDCVPQRLLRKLTEDEYILKLQKNQKGEFYTWRGSEIYKFFQRLYFDKCDIEQIQIESIDKQPIGHGTELYQRLGLRTRKPLEWDLKINTTLEEANSQLIFQFSLKAILPNGVFMHQNVKLFLGCYDEEKIMVEYIPNYHKLYKDDRFSLFGLQIQQHKGSEEFVKFNITEFIKIKTDIPSCQQYNQFLMCSQQICNEKLLDKKYAFLDKNPIVRNSQTGLLDDLPILNINIAEERESILFFQVSSVNSNVFYNFQVHLQVGYSVFDPAKAKNMKPSFLTEPPKIIEVVLDFNKKGINDLFQAKLPAIFDPENDLIQCLFEGVDDKFIKIEKEGNLQLTLIVDRSRNYLENSKSINISILFRDKYMSVEWVKTSIDIQIVIIHQSTQFYDEEELQLNNTNKELQIKVQSLDKGEQALDPLPEAASMTDEELNNEIFLNEVQEYFPENKTDESNKDLNHNREDREESNQLKVLESEVKTAIDLRNIRIKDITRQENNERLRGKQFARTYAGYTFQNTDQTQIENGAQRLKDMKKNMETKPDPKLKMKPLAANGTCGLHFNQDMLAPFGNPIQWLYDEVFEFEIESMDDQSTYIGKFGLPNSKRVLKGGGGSRGFLRDENIYPGKADKMTFKPEIVQHTATDISIAINFYDPKSIYSNGLAQMSMIVKEPSVFKTADTLQPLSSDSFKNGYFILGGQLPAQIYDEEQAQQITDTSWIAATVSNWINGGNFVVGVFLGGALQNLWGMIRTTQMINLVALVMVPIPVSLFVYFEVSVIFCNVDIFSGESFYEKYLVMQESEPINDNFAFFGIGDSNFLGNSGSYFPMQLGIIFYFSISKIVSFVCVKYAKKEIARQIGQKVYQESFWSAIIKGSIKLFVEGYFDIVICCLIQITAFYRENDFSIFWSSRDDIICSTITIIFSPIILAFPFYCYKLIKENQGRFDEQSESYVLEILLEGTNPSKSYYASMYMVFFLFRRLITGIILIILHGYPVFQVSMLTIFSTINFIYLYSTKPMETRYDNNIEIFNELCILISCHVFVLLLRRVLEPEQIISAGWCFVIVGAFNILTNLSVTILISFQESYEETISYYLNFKSKQLVKTRIESFKMLTANENATELDIEISMIDAIKTIKDWQIQRQYLKKVGVDYKDFPEELQCQKLMKEFGIREKVNLILTTKILKEFAWKLTQQEIEKVHLNNIKIKQRQIFLEHMVKWGQFSDKPVVVLRPQTLNSDQITQRKMNKIIDEFQDIKGYKPKNPSSQLLPSIKEEEVSGSESIFSESNVSESIISIENNESSKKKEETIFVDHPGNITVISKKKINEIFYNKFNLVKSGPMFKDFKNKQSNDFNPALVKKYQDRLEISEEIQEIQNEAMKNAVNLDFLIDDDEAFEQRQLVELELERDMEKTRDHKIEDFEHYDGIRPMINGGSNDVMQCVLQVLINCVGFDKFFAFGNYIDLQDTPAQKPLSVMFDKIISQMFRKDIDVIQRPINIDYFCQSLAFRFKMEKNHCAQKVLCHILRRLAIELTPNTLLEEALHPFGVQKSCVDALNKSGIIYQLFSVKKHVYQSCQRNHLLKCNKTEIGLWIPPIQEGESLLAAIQHQFNSTFGIKYCHECPPDECMEECLQRAFLTDCPKFLILFLDFKNDKGILKNCFKGYPLKLDLFWFSQMNKNVRFDKTEGERKFDTKYKICGIISHENGNISQNYSAIVLKNKKELNKERWFKFTAGGAESELKEKEALKYPAQILVYKLRENQ